MSSNITNDIAWLSRGPPRPSPASVTYSEDLEGAKGPLPDSDEDDDGSSSTTEKPSNLGDSSEVSTTKLKIIVNMNLHTSLKNMTGRNLCYL